jgi:hypothetical protein
MSSDENYDPDTDLHWLTPMKTMNFTMSTAALSNLKTPNEEQSDEIKTSTSI